MQDREKKEEHREKNIGQEEEPDWKLTDRKTEKRNCGERHFIRSWMQ